MYDEIVLHCVECDLPWARIRNGCLVIESRHHGKKHVNSIALTELIRQIESSFERKPRETES